MSFLTDEDAWFFAEGTHTRIWEKLGAHPLPGGTRFALWAPYSHRVSVIGSFNEWNADSNPLELHVPTGIWCGVVPNARVGDWYKYRTDSRDHPDPVSFATEPPPGTASVIHDLRFSWSADTPVLEHAAEMPCLVAPDQPYRDLVESFPADAASMGFRQVAFAHPGTSYAPPCHLGPPEDLVTLIDALHARGIAAALRLPELGSEAASGQLRSVHLSRSVFWREVYRFSDILPLESPVVGLHQSPELRVQLAARYLQPGPKLIYVHDEVRILAGTLNHLLATDKALQQGHVESLHEDSYQGVSAYLRRIDSNGEWLLVVLHWSSHTRHNYRIGVPQKGFWREVLNTEAAEFGGTGEGNFGGVQSTPVPLHGRMHSVTLTLPPRTALVFRVE